MHTNKMAKATLFFLLAVANQAFAQSSGIIGAGRDDGEVGELPEFAEVVSVVNAGTGCKNQDVFAIVDGGQSLALITNSFSAQIGPGVPLLESRKNCSASIDIAYPAGWTFAVKSVSMVGATYLESGADATVTARVYTQGQLNDVSFSNKVTGPRRAYLLFGGEISDSALRFQPCQSKRALNIALSASLSNLRNRYARGHVQLGNNAGQAALFELVWRRCR